MTRKLTPKELQVLLTAKWDTSKTHSTSSSTPPPTDEEFAESMKRAIDAITRLTAVPVYKFHHGYKEKREYQEPERDEQGTLYGYKVLLFQYDQILSPQWSTIWNPDGWLVADAVPTQRNTNGIYFTKRDYDEQIHDYYRMWRNTGFVVKCALFGEAVIETEHGFRSHKAQIVAVHDGRSWITFEEMMNYGNRRNSQDSHKRTASYPSDYPQTNWKAYYTYDPSTED